MRGAVSQGLETTICVLPRVRVHRLRVLVTQMPFSSEIMAWSLVLTGLALAKAALVGDFAFLAVIAWPFSIALDSTVRCDVFGGVACTLQDRRLCGIVSGRGKRQLARKGVVVEAAGWNGMVK